MTHAGGDNAGGYWFPKSLQKNVGRRCHGSEAVVNAGALACFVHMYLLDFHCSNLRLLLVVVCVDNLVVVLLHL